MKKKVLKVVAVLAVALMAVWNVGLNETKILFANFFNLKAMATTETYCKNGEKNTGVCQDNLKPGTGKSCMAKAWYQKADCYDTGTENR